MKTIIYHNPRCSKSREALEILEQNGEEVEVIEYLKVPPTTHELESIIKMLNIKPEMLIRKNETVYKEQFKGKTLSDKEWIKIMVEHPVLIERPIVIKKHKAVIGRPPQLIIDIL